MATSNVPANARRYLPAVLDASALIVFVLAGMESHNEGSALYIFSRNAVPLVATWFIVALLLKTYRRSAMPWLAVNWVVAVPLALVLRSLWLGHPTGSALAVFIGIGMTFTALFLVLGRVLLLIADRWIPGLRSSDTTV